MRFGPVFSALPESVPKALYQEQHVKIRRPKPLDTPNVDQTTLIRSIASMLPKEFWYDRNIFPQSDSTLLALAQMSEDGRFVSGWLDSKFSCLPTDKGIALYNKAGRLITEGTSGEVFHYVTSYCKAAMPSVIHLHRFGFVKHVNLTGVLHEDLAAFRQARSFSAGLDRLSKIDELKLIDQDSTINKFPVAEFVQHKVCYHFGAGDNVSTSQRTLSLLYDRVVLVDPRLRSGTDSICSTWEAELENVPCNADIVSDVAYGDSDGVVLGDSARMVEAFYAKSTGRMVVVKYPLQLGIRARGVVLMKPRPHNLEIVVLLDSDGDELDQIYEVEMPKVHEVNRVRNMAVFTHRFNSQIKQLYNTSDEIRSYMRAPPPKLPEPPRTVKMKKPSRNANMAAGADRGGRALRQPLWFRAVKDPMFSFEGPSAVLPPGNIRTGSFAKFDPGLPDVGVSMRTLRNTAIAAGFDVVFENGQWTIK
uniref:Uncharacterized protein n=1 Tax=Kwi virus TaxID=2081616 RepID=A0A2L1CCZ9_9VIRU|nr:hypothetical protein [Kwi virus]